jgi:ribosomal protein S18 acetylase RimI-like enzyme
VLIHELLEEGDKGGVPVRLEVLKNNQAASLYERLGFVRTGDNGLYFQMEKPCSTRIVTTGDK